MPSAVRLTGAAGAPGSWSVPSASAPGAAYRVVWAGPDAVSCGCPGYQYRGVCRHIGVVALALLGETVAGEERAAREQSFVRPAAGVDVFKPERPRRLPPRADVAWLDEQDDEAERRRRAAAALARIAEEFGGE